RDELVTGVQTCALPIYGWGEDTMRLHAAGGDRDCGRNEERPAHSGPAIGSDTRASQPLACTRLARVSEPPCASAICRDSASPIQIGRASCRREALRR